MPEWLVILGGIGDFFESVSWPIVAFLALFILRRPLGRLLSFEGLGMKAEFSEEVSKIERSVDSEIDLTKTSGEPSPEEVASAARVEELTYRNPTLASDEAKALAEEYDRIRARMISGPERTQELELLMTRMRAIGRSISSTRLHYKSSSSAGQRLIAVASLQVRPDYRELFWLVDQVTDDQPFIAFHAAVALTIAARDIRSTKHVAQLMKARDRLATKTDEFGKESDRYAKVQEFITVVDHLAKQVRGPSGRLDNT